MDGVMDGEGGKVKSNKQDLLISLAYLTINTVSVFGGLWLMKRQLDQFDAVYFRKEYHPGPNGRLIVNEYHGETVHKIRYATSKEEWEYSRKMMMERLAEMHLVD